MNFIQRWLGIKSPSEEMQKAYDRHFGIPENILHFDRTHFKATTVGGRKFVYCPVGNICSWAPGDYDNEWCHWCSKFFNEIGA